MLLLSQLQTRRPSGNGASRAGNIGLANLPGDSPGSTDVCGQGHRGISEQVGGALRAVPEICIKIWDVSEKHPYLRTREAQTTCDRDSASLYERSHWRVGTEVAKRGG